MSEENDVPVETEVSKKSVSRGSAAPIPKWESVAKTRIATAIKKLAKPTLLLQEKDAVEADTRHLVTDILVDALGYDKYEDLTAEFAVRGDFADYGLRIDKQLEAFVEVKRISQKLSASHLRQVESYALKEGVQWAILTNAQVWQVYHVSPGKGQQSEVTLVLEVDILDESVKIAQKTEQLFLISREGLSRGRLNDYLSTQNAMSPRTLKPILLSDAVLDEVRRQVRKKTKHNIEPGELRAAIQRVLSAE